MKNTTSNKREGALGRLSKQSAILLIIAIGALGALIMWLGGHYDSASAPSASSESERIREYSVSLEAKIADLCSKVRGASNVTVSVYFDSGFETVYAYNEENKSSDGGYNLEKKYVTIGSGNNESMVTVVELVPNICGVAIVCNGGGDPAVAKELIALISSAYGVPSNKIYVAEGKK